MRSTFALSPSGARRSAPGRMPAITSRSPGICAAVFSVWPAIMTLLATFVGFLYMARFIQAVFLGPRKAGYGRIADAPVALLIPQYLLIAGILVMSFFPKLLIEPVSRAVDPQFASTLIWQGMSLEMIYGYWNPVPVMLFAVAAAALLYGLFWLLRATGSPKSRGRSQREARQ